MPSIPATRRKLLKRPEEDIIQWTLTNHNEKTRFYPFVKPSQVCSTTTLDIAKKFIKLLNNSNNEQKINELVKEIKCLYNTMSFSTRAFVKHVVEEASNVARLLQVYYEVSIQLDILVLTTGSLINYIPEIDEALCELFSCHDNIGQAYIQALNENTLHGLFIKDGKQFVDWSGLMKIENINRLLCIVKRYSTMTNKEICLNQLLHLNTATIDNVNKHYYKQIMRTKEFIFTPNKMTTKQSDTLVIKSPLLQFISTWFFEFNHDFDLKLSEFALNLFHISSESKENVPDISLLLHVYNTGCKQLSIQGNKDHIQIIDIINTLVDACKKSLEQDNSGGLAVILTFAQFAFECMHHSLGYNYASWFQNTFIDPSTSILNKRMGTLFISVLQQLIPYELPSILQIHGKVLNHSTNITNASIYVSTVKKRLFDLGVDSTFKNYPQSIKTPIQTHVVVIEDEISEMIRQFIKRKEVPHSLLVSSVFNRSWFISTFLPKLFSWEGKEMATRDKLIEALKKAGKITDTMYSNLIQQYKK